MVEKNQQFYEKTAENIVWNLNEFYNSPKDPKIDEELKKVVDSSVKFKNDYCGKIAVNNLTVQFLEKALKEYEKLSADSSKISQYAFLNFSLNTLNTDGKALLGKVEDKMAEIENNTLFFRIEICQAPEELMMKLMSSPELSNYHHFLKVTLATKKYQLSEKEEQIINLKNLNGKNAVTKLYDELTSSFKYKMKLEDGKLQLMTDSQIRNLRYHQSGEIRKKSSEVYFKKYDDNLLTISNLYNMIIRDHAVEIKLRGFKSAEEPQNVANELPNEVIDTLIETATKNTPIVQRYYRLKAKLLNTDKLNLCDIYAPVAKSVKKFEWNEAKNIVLDSFERFDKKFHDEAKRFFDNSWIDAKIAPGKRSGAYCSSSDPQLHPFVFMNYTGNMRDVMTLAHELGHALHAVFSSRNTFMNYHSILPLAETASVFSERIVSDNLYKKLTDKNEKIALLTGTLEDFFATSFRQNMFTRFERQAHKKASANVVSADELTEIYKSELKVMFGDSININKCYHVEWSVIPHIFHLPFYCYSYNFGLLLVLALYQKYCEEGQNFKPGFFELLASGGSKDPVEMLLKVGIDIKKAEFWQKGFNFIASKVDELEKIM